MDKQQLPPQQRKSILKNNNILNAAANCEIQLSSIAVAGVGGISVSGVNSATHNSVPSPIIKVQQCSTNSAATGGVAGIPGAHARHSSKFSQKSGLVAIRGASDSRRSKQSNVDSPRGNNPANSRQSQQERKIDIFDIVKQERHPIIRSILENRWFQLVIFLFTIFALFGDDTRVITTTKEADNIFDAINMTCIAIFLVQIVFQYIVEVEYRNSFFFWLDLLSTITILLDIQSLTNAFLFKSNVRSTLQITRASRASRIGTKAGRVVRLVRLIRIARIYKQAEEKKQQSQKGKGIQTRKNRIADKYKNLYNNRCDSPSATVSAQPGSAQTKNIPPSTQFAPSLDTQSPNYNHSRLSHQQQQSQLQPQMLQLFESSVSNNGKLSTDSNQLNKANSLANPKETPKQKELKESRVSKRLSDLTTKRVVIVVLLLLFIMPLFQKSFYFDLPASIDYHTNLLSKMSLMEECSLELLEAATRKTLATLQSMKLPLVVFSQPFNFDGVDFSVDYFNSLRDDELLETYIDFNSDSFLAVHLNDTESARELIKSDPNAQFFWAIMSTRDQMVLQAILSLSRTLFVCIVLTTAAFFFSKDANEIALGPIERMITKVNQIANDPLSAKDQELVDEEQDQYETRIIENAIIKIGALLALGFGEAGSEIIGSNIAKHGDVDPMISGKKKCAIYGFCDIRNFTDATEVLQEDVMIFVNNIGEIVHSMVDRFMGAANKNIGDAFLLVWKFKEGTYQVLEDNQIDFIDEQYSSIMAEFALLSFMKIHAKMNREPIILEYRKDPRLNRRMANYKVKIGFGLHIGWSIEGAIGSEFKIDASYLSPNVSMSARLEGATKGYGVPLLFSSSLHNLLSKEFQMYTRQVDYVMIKGQAEPTGFYTIDMNTDDLPPSKQENLSIEEKMEIEKAKKLITLEFLDSSFFDVETYLRNDKDLRLILRDFDFAFVQQYRLAFQSYLTGDWQKARDQFQAVLLLQSSDGPSLATLEFMQEYDFEPPNDWQGFKPYND